MTENNPTPILHAPDCRPEHMSAPDDEGIRDCSNCGLWVTPFGTMVEAELPFDTSIVSAPAGLLAGRAERGDTRALAELERRERDFDGPAIFALNALRLNARDADPFAEWFAPGYPTELDYMNALEADDYAHEGASEL